MDPDEPFEIADFLPYLLNRAAEEASLGFQAHYRTRHGMLRTEWRVLFHLGRYGSLTAREICDRARIHKTKVSRAVRALEDKRFVRRTEDASDRRCEPLVLTRAGGRAYAELADEARRYDATLSQRFDVGEMRVLRRCLKRLAEP